VTSKAAPFPTRAQLLAFIQESPVPVGKREIARAFHITGEDRVVLKHLLKELEEDGSIEKGAGRRLAPPAALPEVLVLIIEGPDEDGETLARPLNWTDDLNPPPKIIMMPERRGQPTPGVGERVLAKLQRIHDRLYEGRTIRRLEGNDSARIVGVYEIGRDQGREGGRLRPADRRAKAEFVVLPQNTGDARPGELVVAEILPATRYGLKQARIVERLGTVDDPKAVSLIAIHQNGIPTMFPAAAVAEAERAKPPTLAGRIDLRDIPLVTIDGADARDFDDAVFAEPDEDPANVGGWHLLVAIADVSFYVQPGSALDRSAFDRGNSCYFPDRVVPMLPEALSNELCSLKPGVDRACLAVHLWIDRDGSLKRHRFVRGLMRSAARLTYEQVQQARDGQPDDLTSPLLEPVIAPLYGAYAALSAARERRGTLELDVPERQVKLDEAGRVALITVRPRFDSHRLIEEFMIAANVAAAEALEARLAPCMYRVHAEPARDRIEPLREFLKSMGYNLARGQVLQPRAFTQVLETAKGSAESELISTVILRSQAQAVYQPDNIGHFGLALSRYAHFTSPIRRYADLLVHRSLVRAWKLGDDGLSDDEAAKLAQIAEHISMTERRAATAERDSMDRYVAAFLADRVGATFSGKIGGVARFGLFVTLAETGADGIVPVSTLPDDFYDHDELNHCLVGRRSGRTYRLGSPVKVSLVEADPVAGSLVFRLLGEDGQALPAGRSNGVGLRHPARPGGRPTGGRPGSRPSGRIGGGSSLDRPKPPRRG
jgi:ribonuclease R